MQGWELALGAFFDDLESQAEAAFAEERAWEVLDRAAAEFARVDLVGRLMATGDNDVTLEVSGPGRVVGRLTRVTESWCLVEGAFQEWLLPLPAIGLVEGLAPRSIPPEARPVTARLGLGSALRRLAETGLACRVWLRDGTTRDGHLGRVGADFVELVPPRSPERAGAMAIVPWSAIGAVQSRPGEAT